MKKVFWIFLITTAVNTLILFSFIQSRTFANILKNILHKQMPEDFGVEGGFTELEIRFLPPGIILKQPKIVLKESNKMNFPAGTTLEAKAIDVTFQFFQLLTGAVNVNAFLVDGANLKLHLDEKFFSNLEKPKPKKQGLKLLSWESLIQFNFRSISLMDSFLDVSIQKKNDTKPIQIRMLAKEFTVAQSTVGKLPAYLIAVDLEQTDLKIPVHGKLLEQSFTQLQASFEISRKSIHVRSLGLQVSDLHLNTYGSVEGNILFPKSLKSEFSYILKGPIRSWLNLKTLENYFQFPKKDLNGFLNIEGKMKADLLEFEKTFETDASVQVESFQYDHWFAEKAQIKLSWKSPLLTVNSVNLNLGEGKIQIGSLNYNMTHSKAIIQTRIEFENADLRKILGPFLFPIYQLHLKISGKSDVELSYSRGDTKEPFSLKCKTDFKVRNFRLDNQKPKLVKPLNIVLSVPEIDLKSQFLIDSSGLQIEKAEISLPNSKFSATGKVTTQTGFDLNIMGNINLQDIGKISIFDIRGEGKVLWTIKGKRPDVVFNFEPELQNAAYLNLDLGSVKGKIIWDDGKDTLHFKNIISSQGRTSITANGSINLGDSEVVDMQVKIPEGTIPDFSKTFSKFLKQKVPWFPYELTGQLKGELSVTGKTDTERLSILGDLEVANVDYHHEVIRHGRMYAGYRNGAFLAQNVLLRKKNGWLKGNVLYDVDEVLKFDLHSEALSTLDIDQFNIFRIPYHAPLKLQAKGEGKIGSIKSFFEAHLDSGMVKTYVVAPSELRIETENGRLRGRGALLGGKAKATISLGWKEGSTSNFQAEANQLDIKPLLVAWNPVLGEDPEFFTEFTGNTEVHFLTGLLSKLSGLVNIKTTAIKTRKHSLALVKPINVEIHDGNYTINETRLLGENSDFTIHGAVAGGAISHHFSGHLNLAFFELFIPEIAEFNGRAFLEGQILGTAVAPHLKAKVQVEKADLRIRSVEQPFEDIQCQAQWEDTLLKFNNLQSKFAGGYISGGGLGELFYYKVPTLDFQLNLDGTKIKVYPVNYARTSGKLTVKGTQLPYKVSGNLNVAEALIREDFNLSEGARFLRSSKFLPQRELQSKETIQLFNLDIQLKAERGIFVRNNLFDTELRGDLRVLNSISAPGLLGNIDVMYGKLFFKDNFFNIQNGNLRFLNANVMDPEFNLTGQVEVKGYKVLLLSSGKVSDYKLNFESQPPLSQNDIVSLLTFGMTSSGLQSISKDKRDAYSRDEMYGLLFNQSGINKGIQEKLGVKVRVDQSQLTIPESAFKARATSDATQTVAPKVVIQKEVTKNLNASAGSTVGVGDSKEQDVNLEYSMGKRWSVIGVYQEQRGTLPKDSRTSLGADLKFKLRFK